MADYLVIARKWRPQTFEDVIGQDHVVQTLRNAISLGRIAHAFIFSGPRGVGKTSVARIFAKALNCTSGPTTTPCQTCQNCREITDGHALDVHEIDGASNRGIDEVRELRENIKFAPTSSRYKIYIIDEVHMLTKEAFNALLKTLEEPPPHALFIFATTETHKIPATILSRCQCFDFHRISRKSVVETLRRIAEAENIRISPSALAWIAEAGEGSMRDSESIFDQVIAFAGADIADPAVESLLGRTERRHLAELADAVLARESSRCLHIVDDAYASGVDMRVFFGMMLQHFRNLLVAKLLAAGADAVLDLPPEELALMQRQAQSASRETLQRLVDLLMEEEEPLRRSLQPRLNLEMALLRMASLQPILPFDTILGRMEALEKRLAGRSTATIYAPPAPPPSGSVAEATDEQPPVMPPEAPAAADAPSAAPVPDNLDEAWERFKAFVKGERPPLWSKIEPGRMVAWQDNRIVLGFPKNWIFLEDLEMQQKSPLASLASSCFGREVTIAFTTLAKEANDSGNADGSSDAPSRNGDLKREALSAPAVQKVLDVFDGASVREVNPLSPERIS